MADITEKLPKDKLDSFPQRLAFYTSDFTKEEKINLINFLAYKKWEAVKIKTDKIIESLKESK